MNKYDEYPQNGGVDVNFPFGKMKDSTTEFLRDGSPILATLNNDFIGVMTSILDDAGETPSGDPDSVGNPQILNSLKSIIRTIGLQIVPIGSTMAWDKSMPGVPALPDGWVECNGQTLSDPDSPLNGQVIRSINVDKRFIRGGATSGAEQIDGFMKHWHNTTYSGTANLYDVPANLLTGTGAAFAGSTRTATPSINNQTARDAMDDGVTGAPRTADETRPINITMVYIMRVK